MGGEWEQPVDRQFPVELVWDNGAGLKFSRVISIDEDYLFTVKQNVKTRRPLTWSCVLTG